MFSHKFLLVLMVTFICANGVNLPTKQQIQGAGDLKEDWCTQDSSFTSFVDVTLYQCGEECMRRSRCLSILYHWEMHFCTLRNKQIVTIDSTQGQHKLCLSSDIMTWDLAVVDACASRPCDNRSRCFTDEDGTQSCQVTECLEAPAFNDTKISSTVSKILSKSVYFCDPIYTTVGHFTTTCTENGEWTIPNFKCSIRCPLLWFLQNAKLKLDPPRIYVVGDSVDYECIDGYYREQNFEGVQLVCNKDGSWSTPHCLKHCPEPSTVYRGAKAVESSVGPYKVNDKIIVTCESGYKPVHDVTSTYSNTMTCTEYDTWSLGIVCIPVASGYAYDITMKLAYKVSAESRTRAKALQQCLDDGAQLFYVTNSTDFEFGKMLAISRNLQRLIVANVNTNQIDASFWAPGEPAFGVDVYAFYESDMGYLWNDHPANSEANYLYVDRQ